MSKRTAKQANHNRLSGNVRRLKESSVRASTGSHVEITAIYWSNILSSDFTAFLLVAAPLERAMPIPWKRDESRRETNQELRPFYVE